MNNTADTKQTDEACAIHPPPRFIPERYQRWPIRLKWGEPRSSHWFRTHAWQTGSERVSRDRFSLGMMPGYRAVLGWTLHLGRLKICFGKRLALE